jgi:hypothetical protein
VGVLQRFERRLGSFVEGAFARAFRAEVQPVEMAGALQRELDDKAAIVAAGRTLVPNQFVVELGPTDNARLAPYEQALGDELASMVREHADEQRYTFVGPVGVTLEQVDDLDTGMFRIRSTAVPGPVSVRPGPAPAPDEPAARAPRLYAAPSGGVPPDAEPAYVLRKPTAVLGRSADSDLRLADPGVSRRHVELRRDGHRVILRDLGSTNGTLVNGSRAVETELHDGDRIRVGSTTLVFRTGEADPP